MFIPVVLETHGYWSSTVDKLLNTLFKAVADRSRVPYSSLRHYWSCELSAALQRGNGYIIGDRLDWLVSRYKKLMPANMLYQQYLNQGIVV